MRKMLLASVATLALSGTAWADNIVLQAFVDGTLEATLTSSGGTANLFDESFGPNFNLNTLTVNTQSSLAPPGIISTNSLDINQTATGTHQLVVDIQGQGLVGSGTLTGLLSEFSVTGLTNGWSVMEQTFINGVLQATTPLLTGNSAEQDTAGSAILTNPFTAEVRYTVNSNGVGQFNGGIDINTAAVPGPIVGAGLPGLIAGCFGLLGFGRLRKQRQA
jgi:hypothetical protein